MFPDAWSTPEIHEVRVLIGVMEQRRLLSDKRRSSVLRKVKRFFLVEFLKAFVFANRCWESLRRG